MTYIRDGNNGQNQMINIISNRGRTNNNGIRDNTINNTGYENNHNPNTLQTSHSKQIIQENVPETLKNTASSRNIATSFTPSVDNNSTAPVGTYNNTTMAAQNMNNPHNPNSSINVLPTNTNSSNSLTNHHNLPSNPNFNMFANPAKLPTHNGTSSKQH